MSAKLCVALLTLLIASTTVHAAGPTLKMEATHEAMKVKDVKSASEVVDDVRKEFRKSGSYEKMSSKSKDALGTAVAFFSDKVPGLSENTLRRLFLTAEFETINGESIFKVLETLGQQMASGTPAEKEIAETKVELYELTGRRFNAGSLKSPEVQALKNLLSIDFKEIPAALPVAKEILKNLRGGVLTVEESVKRGMKGMKGSLEDFNKLCPPKKA